MLVVLKRTGAPDASLGSFGKQASYLWGVIGLVSNVKTFAVFLQSLSLTN